MRPPPPGALRPPPAPGARPPSGMTLRAPAVTTYSNQSRIWTSAQILMIKASPQTCVWSGTWTSCVWILTWILIVSVYHPFYLKKQTLYHSALSFKTKITLIWSGVSVWVNHSLPGSIAAEISDCASLTLFMASSISLLEASAFSPGVRFSPAARGFSLQWQQITDENTRVRRVGPYDLCISNGDMD